MKNMDPFFGSSRTKESFFLEVRTVSPYTVVIVVRKWISQTISSVSVSLDESILAERSCSVQGCRRIGGWGGLVVSLLLVAAIRNLYGGLVVSALPAEFIEDPVLRLPEQSPGRVVAGRQAVEVESAGDRSRRLAVTGAFGDGLRGEASLRNFSGCQLNHFGSQSGAAETTCKSDSGVRNEQCPVIRKILFLFAVDFPPQCRNYLFSSQTLLKYTL